MLRHQPRVDLVIAPGYRYALPGGLLDAERPTRVFSFLRRAGLVLRGRLHRPHPASFAELRAAHDDDYLERLQRPGALTHVVGFNIPDRAEQELLAVEREMTGGTLLAARLALASRGIAVNVGGGFHHAHRDRGGGFCIFNDVAVAIRAQRAAGFGGRILVVDLDLHDGDGTRSIFADDPTVHTYSVHNQNWNDRPAIEATVLPLGPGVDDARYLETLAATLPPLFERFRPELVVYLCGADPAADDALGDWQVSAAGLLERDRMVTGLARRRHLPLVVTLAGGYGDNSWRYFARFLSWLLYGRVLEPPTTADLIVDRFRDLMHSFPVGELRGTVEEEPLLTEADLGGGQGLASPETRLLGFYSLSGLELALERLGHMARLRELGFASPQVEFDLGASGQTLRIFGSRGRRELLLELRLRRDRRSIPGEELLAVDWLLLQNPRGRFTPTRPALPGQTYPGLGMLRETMAALLLICDRLQLSGLIVTPSHFHAVAQARSQMSFLDPRAEGLFRSFRKALQPLALGEATRAASDGRLRNAETGVPVRWIPTPMILPVTAALRQRLDSSEYERAAADSELELRLEELSAAGPPASGRAAAPAEEEGVP
ncbi:MAG: histone deacetylase [Thermoanaerobaculia bacterium]|nr:histone deacetylase [Thermoanaerobaculia bacterium]MBP9822818.1 histone deacetylase [Thermoanaerobaculia bacterium]